MKKTAWLGLMLIPSVAWAQYEVWCGNHDYTNTERYYSHYYLTNEDRYHYVGEGDGTKTFVLSNQHAFTVLVSPGHLVYVDALTGSDGSNYLWQHEVRCGNVHEFWRVQEAPDNRYAVMRRGHSGGQYSSFLVFTNYANWTGITVHALSSTDLSPVITCIETRTAAELSVPTIEGITYRVQQCENLVSGQWVNTRTFCEGSPDEPRFYESAAATTRFYRVAASGMADPGPALVARASNIVAQVTSSNHTAYSHTTFIDENLPLYRTDCSGFVGYLLCECSPRHYDAVPREVDHAWTRAFKYREFFSSVLTNSTLGELSYGWMPVVHISHVTPGDVLAWSIPNPTQDTGHVMLIAGAPSNSVDNEWMVPVYDSSNTKHFPPDTRIALGTNGVGCGYIKLWVDSEEELTWHQLGPSVDSNDNPIAIGRPIAIQ